MPASANSQGHWGPGVNTLVDLFDCSAHHHTERQSLVIRLGVRAIR